MSEQSDPKLGINSWLEEELYQTYLHDRKYVDESWKERLRGQRSCCSRHLRSPRTDASQAVADPRGADRCARRYLSAPNDELTPLRGVAGKIAENMAISLIDPDGDLAADRAGSRARRKSAADQPASRDHRQEQSFLHAHHRLGDPARAGRIPPGERRLHRAGWAALPHRPEADQFRPRRGREGQGRIVVADGPEYQERRALCLSGSTWPRSTTSSPAHAPAS